MDFIKGFPFATGALPSWLLMTSKDQTSLDDTTMIKLPVIDEFILVPKSRENEIRQQLDDIISDWFETIRGKPFPIEAVRYKGHFHCYSRKELYDLRVELYEFKRRIEGKPPLGEKP